MKKLIIATLLLVVFTVIAVLVMGTQKDHKVKFSLRTTINQETKLEEVHVLVETTKEYECANYTLESDTTFLDGVITFNFGGVYMQGDICLDAFGPARATYNFIPLGELKSIKFISGDRVDLYDITVTESEIEISQINSTFSNTELNTVPLIEQNTIEAHCFYNSSVQNNPWDDHCKGFYAELDDMATLIKEPLEGKNPRSLYYTYQGDYDKLLDLVEEYDREGHYVLISTWDQQTITCHGSSCSIQTGIRTPDLSRDIEYTYNKGDF